jgi:hypothetical protein
MINRRRRFRLFFRIKPAQFKMRRAGMRIHLQRFLERLDCSAVIHRVHPLAPALKMRLLFLIRLARSRWQTTAQRRDKKCRQHRTRQSNRNHDATLNEPPSPCNRDLPCNRVTFSSTANHEPANGFFLAPLTLAIRGRNNSPMNR